MKIITNRTFAGPVNDDDDTVSLGSEWRETNMIHCPVWVGTRRSSFVVRLVVYFQMVVGEKDRGHRLSMVTCRFRLFPRKSGGLAMVFLFCSPTLYFEGILFNVQYKISLSIKCIQMVVLPYPSILWSHRQRSYCPEQRPSSKLGSLLELCRLPDSIFKQ